MNFTASELRNKNYALLRRVQRQMDNKPIVEEDFSKLFKEKKEKDFKEFKEEKKQTKLGLYKNRSSGRW